MQEHDHLSTGRTANHVMQPNAVRLGEAMREGLIEAGRQTGSLGERCRRFLREPIDANANGRRRTESRAFNDLCMMDTSLRNAGMDATQPIVG